MGKLPIMGNEYFKDFDTFVSTNGLQVLDQEDAVPLDELIEKEALKSSSSSQKLQDKADQIRSSKELAQ